MSKRPRDEPLNVICVGSTMIEQFAYCERAPGPGETIVGKRTAQGWGGKGANQAVQARHLGSRVAMVNCVGDDSYGTAYRKKLGELGIDTDHIYTAPNTASGCAPIWVEADGTNRIIVVPGANDKLTPEEAVGAVEALHKGSPVVVVGQMEIPQHVTAAAFAAAKRLGATTVLNPAPAQAIIPDLLAASDWVIPNESEFALLAKGALSDEPPTDEAIKAFASTLGPQRLLVTLGAAGVALVGAGGDAIERLDAPPLSAPVVDTTGAGDSFVGAFCHGLAQGLSERDAVSLGMRCASDSVTREGTQPSFPDRARCEALGFL